MTLNLRTLGWDAHDPHRLARFWSGLLGWETTGDGLTLVPDDDTGFDIRFAPTQVPRTAHNKSHVDLRTESPEHQQQTVELALRLGARHIDIGQATSPGPSWPTPTATSSACTRPGRRSPEADPQPFLGGRRDERPLHASP